MGVIKTKPLMVRRQCNDCAYQRTMECPNSALCYNTEDKPYFTPKEKKQRAAARFSDSVVIASVIAVSVFTLLAFIVLLVTDKDIPQHWWASWFGFWGVEIVTLATITHRKIKRNAQNEKEESEDG